VLASPTVRAKSTNPSRYPHSLQADYTVTCQENFKNSGLHRSLRPTLSFSCSSTILKAVEGRIRRRRVQDGSDGSRTMTKMPTALSARRFLVIAHTEASTLGISISFISHTACILLSTLPSHFFTCASHFLSFSKCSFAQVIISCTAVYFSRK